jgi:hypothetical protein
MSDYYEEFVSRVTGSEIDFDFSHVSYKGGIYIGSNPETRNIIITLRNPRGFELDPIIIVDDPGGGPLGTVDLTGNVITIPLLSPTLGDVYDITLTVKTFDGARSFKIPVPPVNCVYSSEDLEDEYGDAAKSDPLPYEMIPMFDTVNVSVGSIIQPDTSDLVLMRATRFTGAFFNVTGATLELQGNGGNLVLDGNKGNVTAPTVAPLVTVGASGELTMGNGVCLQNNHNTFDDGGAVKVDGTMASFTMEGGTITRNESVNRGGGVALFNGGSFTMNDGSITHNFAGTDGGGVSMDGSTLTMNGGTISYNRAGLDHDGGGVAVYGTSIFLMAGGSISYNQVSSEAPSDGAGVYFGGGSGNGSGGEIKHNIDAVNKGDIYMGGGALTPTLHALCEYLKP